MWTKIKIRILRIKYKLLASFEELKYLSNLPSIFSTAIWDRGW
jgi:hypothetical protein